MTAILESLEAINEDMRPDEVYRQIEVMARRRRDWTVEPQAGLTAERFQPGTNVSEVARRNGVDRGLLGVWRRQAQVSVMPAALAPLFATMQMKDGTAVPGAAVAAVRKADVKLEAMAVTTDEGDSCCRFNPRTDPASVSCRHVRDSWIAR